MTTEMWRTAELIFHSERPYADPLMEAETTVDFLSASGTRIRRPAFWNGGDAFGVRVALTEPGDWTYQTVCFTDKPVRSAVSRIRESMRFTKKAF